MNRNDLLRVVEVAGTHTFLFMSKTQLLQVSLQDSAFAGRPVVLTVSDVVKTYGSNGNYLNNF